jgi:hypothetical protein
VLKLPAPPADALKPTSHKTFLRNYWNPNKPTKTVVPTFLRLFGVIFILFLFFTTPQPACILLLTSLLFPKKQKIKRNPPKSYICNANILLFRGFFLFFS